MEHFKSPFEPRDFVSEHAIENRAFFVDLLERAKNHPFFSHPFLSTLDDGSSPREVVSFILSSFYKVVTPFTGLLCALAGQAPNLRSRFALMDNIYEEMGCGDLKAAHPNLYLRMLESIGVTEKVADSLPRLPSIGRINDHLREVVERGHFSVASAVLASAESTIPRSFPVLADMARRTFPEIDMTFFDRHGVRDDGHSDDASMLFVLNADTSHFPIAEAEVRLDLDYRNELLDEWMCALSRGEPPRPSDGPSRLPGARHASSKRPNAPPPG